MNDVLGALSPTKTDQVLHAVVERAAKSPDFGGMTTLAAIMTAPGCTPEIRHALELDTKRYYDNATTKEVKNRFGLLAATYVAHAPQGIQPTAMVSVLGPFFLGMTLNQDYYQPKAERLEKQQLVDERGVCNQLMVFPNDDDGKSSFAHWQDQYANQPGWVIDPKESYVHIYHEGGKVPVHIYANRPEQLEGGIATIEKQVAHLQGKSKPSFQVFAARGHCYHLKEYLDHMDGAVGLSYLGFCGGSHDMSTVLQKSPDAQILSTAQKGAMAVNDPMLFSINQSINQFGVVVWKEQQKVLDHIPSEDRKSYILPPDNIALAMHKQYNTLKREPWSAQELLGLPANIGASPYQTVVNTSHRR